MYVRKVISDYYTYLGQHKCRNSDVLATWNETSDNETSEWNTLYSGKDIMWGWHELNVHDVSRTYYTRMRNTYVLSRIAGPWKTSLAVARAELSNSRTRIYITRVILCR